MRGLITLAFCLMPLHGEIIDRIAVTIGTRVITESMLIQQLRLAAFYDNKAPEFSAASKREAAETLVSRYLLTQEMDDTRFTVPSMTEVLDYAKEMLGSRFPDERAYITELANRKLTDDEVRVFLQNMIRVLQFIELRFQRGQTVSTEEIGNFYNRQFRERWEKKNPSKPVPPLDEVSDEIEQEILAGKTDAAVDEWMKQMKETADIRYRPEVFQ